MLTYGQGQLIWKIFLSALCPVTSGGDALEPKDCGILFTSQNPLLQLRPVPMCTDPLPPLGTTVLASTGAPGKKSTLRLCSALKS